MRVRQHSGTFTLSGHPGMMQTVWKFVSLGCSVMAVRRDFEDGPEGVVPLFLVFDMCTVEAVELLCFDVVCVVGDSVRGCFEGVVCGVQVLLLGERL